jgi:hypothetical protein
MTSCRWVKSLLEQFLSEECTPFTRRLLEEALGDASVHRRLFEFDRFEVTIDRDAGVAELVDVLSPPESPTERVTRSETGGDIVPRGVIRPSLSRG